MCNAGMDDLHPDMSTAAAEIYASSIAQARVSSHHLSERGGASGRWEDQACQHSGLAFAMCATKYSKLRHIDFRQRWVLVLRNRTILIICDLVKVGTNGNLSNIFTKILGPNMFESLRDRMMVTCNMPTPEELKSEAEAAAVQQRLRRKAVRLEGG